jgi:phosphohistidine phosphatase
MRHAKSDWLTAASADFDRQLSSRGKRDGARMGEWLQSQQLIPDCFISSPAKRAKQTSKLVAKEIGVTIDAIIWRKTVYEASLQDLLKVVETYSPTATSMLLVGHNPGLDDLLCYLASEPPILTSTGKLMTTAAIAVLNFGDKAISSNPQSAALDVLIRPKELVKS